MTSEGGDGVWNRLTRDLWTTIARLSSLKESERLRVIGSLVLVSGIVSACVFYWIEAPTAVPTIDDSSALGYVRTRDHEIGVMMGHFGVM